MNILIVSDSYPPEIGSGSHLMHEMAEELRDRGHAITVATCFPRYNLAKDTAIEHVGDDSCEDGIRVLRIKSLPHHKVNFLIRGISQLTLPFVFWRKIKRHLKTVQFDAVIVYSPPLPLWLVGKYVKETCGARFILNIQDIFPQNAIDLDVMRNPLLIHFFEWMERKAYEAADVITVHSRGNREFLIQQKSVRPEKLAVLHNWVSIKPFVESAGRGEFRQKWGLENKFIIFFGGVMGASQGLDIVIEAAKELRDEKDSVILFAGDGMEKVRLEQLARNYGLQNVIFQPFVSKEDYQKLLREVDVGLLCLTAKNKTPPVPGKILGYMSAGLPVMALLNRESDGHHIIREAQCGCSAVSDHVENAVNLIRKMYQERNRFPEWGLNGYRYVVDHFSVKVCADQLEALCRDGNG